MIGATIFLLMWIVGAILSGYGYIHNIILFAQHINAFDMLEVLRAIGIIAAPLGVVLGYIG